VAVAIAGAERAEQRAITEALQRHLLPHRLPQLPGLRISANRGIHLGGVEWSDVPVAVGRSALSAVAGRVPGVVSDRRGLSGLPGVAALASGLRVSGVRSRAGVGVGGWAV
jgi:hypothetical protein